MPSIRRLLRFRYDSRVKPLVSFHYVVSLRFTLHYSRTNEPLDEPYQWEYVDYGCQSLTTLLRFTMLITWWIYRVIGKMMSTRNDPFSNSAGNRTQW